MSFFDEFHKKEKPVFTGIARGIGGFGFGAASAAEGTASAFASGGNIDGQPGGNGYIYHVFTAPGTLTVPGPKSAEILLVAGGGSGGATNSSNGAGGGGAGGIVHHTQLALTGPLTITVGDGGVHPNVGDTVGDDGDDSTIVSPTGPWTLTAKGGGGGGEFSAAGRAGGSGGGGGGNTQSNPTAGNQPAQNTPFVPQTGFNQYGNAGGAPVDANPGNASGGGGAGGAGQNHNAGAADPVATSGGGIGRPFSGFAGNIPALSPLPAAFRTATGPTGLYGGGGAGENPYNDPDASTAPGGPGGGGSGPSPTGIQYTGGGGAGRDTGPLAGDGGNGVVMVRYLS